MHPIDKASVAGSVEEHPRGLASVEADAGVGAFALEIVEFPEHRSGHHHLGARERMDHVRVVEQRVGVDDVDLRWNRHVARVTRPGNHEGSTPT
jgi:hypothetical protein